MQHLANAGCALHGGSSQAVRLRDALSCGRLVCWGRCLLRWCSCRISDHRFCFRLQARKRAAAREQSGVGGGGGLATLGGGDASDSGAYSNSSDREADEVQPRSKAARLAREHASAAGAPPSVFQPELAHAGMVPAQLQAGALNPKPAATLADREALALSLLAG